MRQPFEIDVPRKARAALSLFSPLHRPHLIDAMDIVRRTKIRRRAEEHAIDDAEHRGIGTDAEAECEHHADREHRLGAKTAERVSKILKCCFDEDRAARVATCFRGAVDATKGQASAPKGLVARKAGLLVFLRFVLDVRAELLGKLALDVVAAEECSQPVLQITYEFADHRQSLPWHFYRTRISVHL